jgi:hypothetical protein
VDSFVAPKEEVLLKMKLKSILDEIVDNLSETLSKHPSFSSQIIQSLREIIDRGEYRNKEAIVELFKKREFQNENT